MSDYDLPDLPSDDELGITEGDVQKYGDQVADDGAELSEKEMAELLGGSKGGGAEKASTPEDPKEAKRRARQRAKDEKKRRKEEKRRAKQQKNGSAASGGADGTAEAAGDAGGAATGESGDDAGSGGGPPPSGPKALAPMPAWRGPVTLLLLAVLALFSSSRTGEVDPAPANAPDSEFSSARAMSVLVDVAREPHPPGSPEHARVRDLLLERLTQLGLDPEVQTTTSLLERRGLVSGDPAVARSATVRNIVARVPGSDPTGTVLITAHYDSRQIAVGAGDDGTGVVTILEALRALRTGSAPRNDIIVLLTDAEELGLMGARAFVDDHPWMPDVDLVLSFEMRGGGGPSIMFETNERNGWIVRALQDFASRPFANSLSYEVYRRLPNDTDFTPFREAGVQGLNFAAIDNARIYHQAYDVPENVSQSTIQHHGNHALAGLQHFGNADLTTVNDSNVVFFTVPGLGLVVYGSLWILPISLLLVLGFVGLIVAGRRAGARTSRLVAGTTLSAVVGVVSYGVAAAAFGWLTGLHAEYGALLGSAFHNEGWYVLAIVFTVLLLMSGAMTLSGRWITPIELGIGAVILPLLLALAAGFVAPLAAMNLQWPVAAAILSTLVMALLGPRASGTVGWIVAAALVVPVVVVLQPVLELLWLAMSLELAGGLAVIATVGFLLCVPLLTSLQAPNRWWAPLSFGLLAAACLGTGMLRAGPSAETPAPSTLVYAYEHGADSAVWATRPSPELAVSNGADEEAPPAPDGRGAAWAMERVGGAFGARERLERFGYRPDTVPVAPARVLLAEPPAVDVVTDTVLGESRRAVLHVRSRIGAEMLGFQLGGETRLTAVNGQPVSNVEELRWIDHWGEPDSAVVLELTMPPGSPIDVHVIEHLLRPEELLGRDAFRRPPELAPNVVWLSDRAMFRYSVARFADPARPEGPR